MADFASEHANIISEYCLDMLNIERAVFINSSSFMLAQKVLLAKHSVVILYSIWEGFVSKSFQLYIEHINNQMLTYDKLIDSILIYNMENRFKQFKNYPIDINKKGRFFAGLYNHCQSDIVQIPTIVNTKSNVDFKMLNRLLCTFGLESFPENWEAYKHPKASSLKARLNDFLRYRHTVAHGGDVADEEITQEKYSRYRSMIRDLMYGMHDRFLEGINNRSYMKHT